MLSGRNGRVRRTLRRAALTRDPRYRREDHLEGALLLAALPLAVLLLVVAVLSGTAFARHERAIAAAQLAERQRVPVVLLADTTVGEKPAGDTVVVVRLPVRAEWTLPDGTRRTGSVPTDTDAKAGQTVTVWMDATWNPVPPPADAASVRANGVVGGLVTFLLGGWLLIAAYSAACSVLDRRRLTGWEQDWATVEPRWRNLR